MNKVLARQNNLTAMSNDQIPYTKLKIVTRRQTTTHIFTPLPLTLDPLGGGVLCRALKSHQPTCGSGSSVVGRVQNSVNLRKIVAHALCIVSL